MDYGGKHLKALDKHHQCCFCKILQVHWEDECTNANVLPWANMTSIETLVSLVSFIGKVIFFSMLVSRLQKQTICSELYRKEWMLSSQETKPQCPQRLLEESHHLHWLLGSLVLDHSKRRTNIPDGIKNLGSMYQEQTEARPKWKKS